MIEGLDEMLQIIEIGMIPLKKCWMSLVKVKREVTWIVLWSRWISEIKLMFSSLLVRIYCRIS